MRRFKKFYEHKELKRLEKIYVFGTGSVSEIADAIAAEEAEGKVVIIDQAAFPVPMSLLSAYGAALRGTIPPMRDSGFTLASRSAKDDYLRDLTRNFVRLWRVMSLVTISLLVVLFGIGDLYMVKSVRGLEEKAATLLSEPLANEAALLEEKAAEFNSFVDVLESAKKLTPEWSPLLGVVQSIARIHRISLDRIFINNESQLLLVGKAPEERAIVSFKDALALRPELKDVALPLTDIKSLPDGSFSFLLNGGIVKPET